MKKVWYVTRNSQLGKLYKFSGVRFKITFNRSSYFINYKSKYLQLKLDYYEIGLFGERKRAVWSKT